MIANKTTTVSAERTVAEIQSMLASARASALMIDYEACQPSAIAFKLDRGGTHISFRLPSNWQGILAALKKDRTVPRRYCCEEHARRVSWRVVRDWLRAQLTLVEAGASTIEEVMLPWAITADGSTVAHRMLSGAGLLALPSPTTTPNKETDA